MNIYFAWSIRWWRADKELYAKIIGHLQNYWTVLTEHIWLASLSAQGERDISDERIYRRDMEWLVLADLIVAEVTTPSLWVWYELGRAHKIGKKMLCLHRPEVNRLSAMVGGNAAMEVLTYESYHDLTDKLDVFFTQ